MINSMEKGGENMKEIDELIFLDNIRYSNEHLWAKADGENFTIGISDYAQDQLGDVVFVDLPQPGDKFGKNDEFGSVESVKTLSELYMPISGEIVKVNSNLEDAPEMVNQKPYEDGWMIVVKPDNPAEYDDMLANEEYVKTLK
jgi:glycine cleavage system H protein